MADGLDPFHVADGGAELRLVKASLRDLELAVGENAVVVVNEAQLE